VSLRRARPAADGRYEIAVRARRDAGVLRVVGLPHDGGAHVRGVSREVGIAGIRR
jgi:hypothetical protein